MPLISTFKKGSSHEPDDPETTIAPGTRSHSVSKLGVASQAVYFQDAAPIGPHALALRYTGAFFARRDFVALSQ
jgi:hypothetical protein